jgi:hypothetical protein
MSGVGKMFSGIFGKPEVKSTIASVAPKVDAPAADADKERLIRTGRASLISTTSQGTLGNASTGRKQLSV